MRKILYRGLMGCFKIYWILLKALGYSSAKSSFVQEKSQYYKYQDE